MRHSTELMLIWGTVAIVAAGLITLVLLEAHTSWQRRRRRRRERVNTLTWR